MILVTGGTGFIGGHLVDALLKRRCRIKCLVRKDSNTAYLKNLDVELIYGDLLDRESLKDVVKGVSVVYHLATQTRSLKIMDKTGELLDMYQRIDLSGTQNLVEAALTENISRFIYFSSTAALGPGDNLSEDSCCRPNTDYGISKLKTEEYLLSTWRTRNFPALIIRPGHIYGPRCPSMNMFFKLIKRGFFISIGDGSNWIPLCYISDLIKGVLLAQEKGKSGNIYFIFEKTYMFREYIQTIAEAVGGRINKLYIPKRVAYAGMRLKDICESIFHFKIYPFRMDFDKIIALFSTSWHGSIDKARIGLGYSPDINLKMGMELTIKWYKDAGLL